MQPWHLDEQSEARVYQLLAEWSPDVTIISIAHRAALTDFHSKLLELKPDGDGRVRMIASGVTGTAAERFHSPTRPCWRDGRKS